MRTLRFAMPLVLVVSACSDGGGTDTPDAPTADAPSGCDPATVLPANYRPIAEVSTGAVSVITASDITSGTIDATGGGIAASADRPYVYVDLVAGTRVDVNDLAARTDDRWDIALKRSSLRINGGDSGGGGRSLAIVAAPALAAVTTVPASGFTEDDFANNDCMLEALPGGEPSSAFGEWYDYDVQTHAVTPRAEVYVLKRGDGTHTALRLITYYGDTGMPMRGAFYRVEWKHLTP